MNKLTIIGFFFSLVFAQISSCDKQEQGEVREFFSINSKVELLFFYTKESSYEERNYFNHNILSKNSPRGHGHRDGVQTIFGIDKHGYTGFGITFRSNATKEQREDIKKRLKQSRIVYKIFENVVPSELVLDEAEAEKERIENAKRDTDDKRPKKTVTSSEPQN